MPNQPLPAVHQKTLYNPVLTLLSTACTRPVTSSRLWTYLERSHLRRLAKRLEATRKHEAKKTPMKHTGTIIKAICVSRCSDGHEQTRLTYVRQAMYLLNYRTQTQADDLRKDGETALVFWDRFRFDTWATRDGITARWTRKCNCKSQVLPRPCRDFTACFGTAGAVGG